MFPYVESRYLTGVIFIVLCATLWAGSSVLIQYIYEDMDFRSPILLTYISTSLLALHLPAHTITEYWNSKRSNSRDTEDKTSLVRKDFKGDYVDSLSERDCPESSNSGNEVSHQRLLKAAMVIAPLWFLSNCLYNYSLMMTSVSSSTIISNLSASFTLLFSWQSGLEDLSVSKILGVLICFGGAVMVGLVDDESDDSQGSIGGDIIALISSAGYGLYTTLIRYFVDDEMKMPMQLTLGYIGLLNVLILVIPIAVLASISSPIIGHLNGKGFGFVVLDGVFDTAVADFCWAKAIVYTSPTVATIGMSITIPLALITDFLIYRDVPTGVSIGGAFLVIIGFILVNLDDKAVFGRDIISRGNQ